MGNNSDFQDVNVVLEHQPDDASLMLAVPLGKLDADEYSAQDLDGVTESLFGSGNLNFLSLQSGQTNDAITLNDLSNAGPTNAASITPFFIGGYSSSNEAFADHNIAYGAGAGHDASTDTDRALDTGEHSHIDSITTNGNFTNTTVGSLGASTLASDKGAFSPGSNLNLSNGNISDDNTTNIGGDTHITNETVQNITNGVGDTIQNVVNTVTQTISNITDLGDQLITDILHGDVTNVVNTVTNQVSQVTDTINNILDNTGINNIVNVGDVINQVVNNETLNQVTHNITNIADQTISNVTNAVNDLLGDGKIGLDLHGGALGSLGADVGLTIDHTITGGIGSDALTGHTADIIHDLTGLNLPFLGDSGADIGFNLLNGGVGTDNNAGDSDISIAGLHLPDIALDPVEGIVGDIDIHASIPAGLTDPGALVADIQDLADGLNDLQLGDINDLNLGGQGADGSLGLDIFNHNIGQDFNVTGDSATGNVGSLLDGVDPGDPSQSIQNILDHAGDIVAPISDVAFGLEDTVQQVTHELTGDDLPVGGGLVDDLMNIIHDLPNQVDNTIDAASNVASTTVNDPIGSVSDIVTNPASAVQDISSAVDPAIQDALNHLGGDQSGSIIGGLTDTLDNAWTDNSGSSNGGLFDDIVQNGNDGGTLPDPVGGIVEGLGSLIPHDASHGGGHHGGLFH